MKGGTSICSVSPFFCASSLLIVHPKVPQWNDDTMTCFNVIFDDDSIGHILYLPAAFVAATHLESIRVDEEITLSGDNYTIAHTHLVVEEGLLKLPMSGLPPVRAYIRLGLSI